MTHPFIYARTTPEKPAVVLAGSGASMSFAEMEGHANQLAHLMRSIGMKRGECVAILLENSLEVFAVAWAAERAGLYYSTISTRLTVAEAEYIIRDSGSRAFFTSSRVGAVNEELARRFPDLPKYMAGEPTAGFMRWEDAIAGFPTTPIADESAGSPMLYSSGTTGRPKGVKRRLSEKGLMTLPPFAGLMVNTYGGTSDSVFLCPAPVYHAAPLAWSMMAHRIGATVILMEKFDAEEVLRAVERYKVSIAQFVPTHFVRLLNLPEETKSRYDLSSLKVVFHAGAPCPVSIKERIMEWWGPIVHEYYSATEGNGLTAIGPQEWLEHRGSVGRAIGCTVYICDDNGDPLPPNQEGSVFFSGGLDFEYHNEPEKTAESRNRHGWTTIGDIGRLDPDGYLYLTDRKSFMIISGGVNIYPQEIENLLQEHPKVADVAVIGAPDTDLGERVVAVVQPFDMRDAGPALADELRNFARQSLSGIKTPRQFDFVEELPRHATGKLYKRVVRDAYWSKPASA